MFEDTCRLCLGSEDLLWIFSDKMADNMNEIIQVSSGVEISKTDSVTQMVCSTCCQITIKMYKFRTTSIKNDKDLKARCADYNISQMAANSGSVSNAPKEIKEIIKPESTAALIVKSPIPMKYKFAHPSIRDVVKLNPGIKLPDDCLKNHVGAYITLLTDEVDDWFKEKNLTDQDIARLKREALELEGNPPVKKQKTEVEVKQKTEVEVKRKTGVEVKRKAEVEVKRKTEVDIKRKTEVDIKRKTEIEVKRKAEVEVKRKAEVEVKRKAEVEVKPQIEEEIVRDPSPANNELKTLKFGGRSKRRLVSVSSVSSDNSIRSQGFQSNVESETETRSMSGIGVKTRKNVVRTNPKKKKLVSNTPNGSFSSPKEDVPVKSHSLDDSSKKATEKELPAKPQLTYSVIRLNDSHKKGTQDQVSGKPESLSSLLPQDNTKNISQREEITLTSILQSKSVELQSNEIIEIDDTPCPPRKPIKMPRPTGEGDDFKLFSSRPFLNSCGVSKRTLLNANCETVVLSDTEDGPDEDSNPNNCIKNKDSGISSANKNTENSSDSDRIVFDLDSRSSTNSSLKSDENSKTSFAHALELAPKANEQSNMPDLSLVSLVNKSYKLYTCKVCDSQHTSLKDLKYHGKKTHTRCAFCNKRFRTLAHRDEHVKSSCCTTTTTPVQLKNPKLELKRVDEDDEIKKKYASAFEPREEVTTEEPAKEKAAEFDQKTTEVVNEMEKFLLKSDEDVICISDEESETKEKDGRVDGVQPKMNVVNSDIVKNINVHGTDSTILREILFRYDLIKTTIEGQTESLNSDKNPIVDGQTNRVKIFKNLRKYLHRYKIPIEVEYGATMSVKYKPKHKESTVNTTADLWYSMKPKELILRKEPATPPTTKNPPTSNCSKPFTILNTLLKPNSTAQGSAQLVTYTSVMNKTFQPQQQNKKPQQSVCQTRTIQTQAFKTVKDNVVGTTNLMISTGATMTNSTVSCAPVVLNGGQAFKTVKDNIVGTTNLMISTGATMTNSTVSCAPVVLNGGQTFTTNANTKYANFIFLPTSAVTTKVTLPAKQGPLPRIESVVASAIEVPTSSTVARLESITNSLMPASTATFVTIPNGMVTVNSVQENVRVEKAPEVPEKANPVVPASTATFVSMPNGVVTVNSVQESVKAPDAPEQTIQPTATPGIRVKNLKELS